VKMDLNAYFRKLTQKFESDPNRFSTLQRMVEDEMEYGTAKSPNSATEALTWTRRGITFLRQFLDGYEQGETDLAKCCAEAYSKTLKPHHDWVVRGVYTIACKSAATKDQFTASLAVSPTDVGTEAFERQLKSDLISCLAGIDRCLKAVDKYESDARTQAD